MYDAKGKGEKLEPKLNLDMDFGEALERFAQTKPKEMQKSIERSKQKNPPGNDAPGGLEPQSDREPHSDRHRKPKRDASAG